MLVRGAPSPLPLRMVESERFRSAWASSARRRIASSVWIFYKQKGREILRNNFIDPNIQKLNPTVFVAKGRLQAGMVKLGDKGRVD